MKLILAFIASAALSFSAFSACNDSHKSKNAGEDQALMKAVKTANYSFQLKNIACGSCASKIEAKLEPLKKNCLSEVNVDIEKNTVFVGMEKNCKAKSPATSKSIATLISQLGSEYKVTKITDLMKSN